MNNAFGLQIMGAVGALSPALIFIPWLLRLGQRRLPLNLVWLSIFSAICFGMLAGNFHTIELEVLKPFPASIRALGMAFLGAGFCEELSKLAAVWFIARRHYACRGSKDLMLSAVAVGLGFALVENVQHVLSQKENWSFTAWMRADSSIPEHLLLGLYMGYRLAVADAELRPTRRVLLLIYALLSVTFLHGIYDFPLFVTDEGKYPEVLRWLSAHFDMSEPAALGILLLTAHILAVFAAIRALRWGLGQPLAKNPRRMAVPWTWFSWIFAPATGIVLIFSSCIAALFSTETVLEAIVQSPPAYFEYMLMSNVVALLALAYATATTFKDAPFLQADHARHQIWSMPELASNWQIVWPRHRSLIYIFSAVCFIAICGLMDSPRRKLIAFMLSDSATTIDLKANRYLRARQTLTRALTYNDQSPDIFKSRAAAANLIGENHEALNDLAAAIALNPDDLGAVLLRASTLDDVGQPQAAIVDLDAALKRHSDNADLLRARGVASFYAGDLASAKVFLAKALAKIGKSAVIEKDLAELAIAEKDFSGAGMHYDAAVKLAPNEAAFVGDRGRFRLIQDHANQAVQDLSKAVALNHGEFLYDQIWLVLAKTKMDQQTGADLASNAADLLHHLALDKDKGELEWPYPLLQYYAEQLSDESLKSAAVTAGQICEMGFYKAERSAVKMDETAAIEGFKEAVKSCPLGFIERRAAAFELAIREEKAMWGDMATPLPDATDDLQQWTLVRPTEDHRSQQGLLKLKFPLGQNDQDAGNLVLVFTKRPNKDAYVFRLWREDIGPSSLPVQIIENPLIVQGIQAGGRLTTSSLAWVGDGRYEATLSKLPEFGTSASAIIPLKIAGVRQDFEVAFDEQFLAGLSKLQTYWRKNAIARK